MHIKTPSSWSAPALMSTFLLICLLVIFGFESIGLLNKEKNLENRMTTCQLCHVPRGKYKTLADDALEGIFHYAPKEFDISCQMEPTTKIGKIPDRENLPTNKEYLPIKEIIGRITIDKQEQNENLMRMLMEGALANSAD